MLEDRAARARRRLLITLTMLALAVGGWTAFAFGVAPWFLPVLPTILLVAVLALGRSAAAADRRVNERWAAQRRAVQRAEASARALASGGPQTPRHPAVLGERTAVMDKPDVRVVATPTGFAASTYTGPSAVIGEVTGPIVTSSVGASAKGVVAVDVPVPVVSGPSSAEIVEEIAAAAVAEVDTESSVAAEAQPPAKATSMERAARFLSDSAAAASAASAADEAPISYVDDGAYLASSPVKRSRAWAPRPIPAPLYTEKDAAPQREPAPITTMYPAASDLDIEALVAASAPPTVEARPRTDTLGLPLNEILARRRAG